MENKEVIKKEDKIKNINATVDNSSKKIIYND